jgi:4-amino-4-deoxy-L-arabinose transferase-like glycosyltransferase
MLAGAIHLWLFWHTEVAARDSIGYIRYAWRLEHHPWIQVVRGSVQHPGYPFTILAMSQLVRHVVAQPESVMMQWSAQLVSALAGLLLVIPTYYLGRELFNRRVGFWASLIFQAVPASSRVLADGLSEALFLLFAASALLLAVRALRQASPLQFGLCGVFSGLAYFTRPEGALIVVSAGTVLLVAPLIRAWSLSWRTCLACGSSLALGALVTGGPLLGLTGHLTTKTSANQLLHVALQSRDREGAGPPVLHDRNSDGPLLASMVGFWWPGGQPGPGWDRGIWPIRAVAGELLKGFYYVLWLPALLGLWWERRKWSRKPGAWVLLLLCVMLALILVRLASVMGYVSDRHALLIILCGCYWGVAGLVHLSGRLPQRLYHPLAAPVLLTLLVAATLPKTLEPLHWNRGGFRAAGLWLAAHSTSADEIDDPYCWAHYYAGRVFIEDEETHAPDGHVPVWYLVVENAKSQHERLTKVNEVQRLKELGEPVWRWTGKRRKDEAEVVVYRVPAEAAQSLLAQPVLPH